MGNLIDNVHNTLISGDDRNRTPRTILIINDYILAELGYIDLVYKKK